MAKGTLHLNVEFSAVADEEGKFGRLASLLGLADADHARGKCEHLWVACTRRGESDLPQWLVEQILGQAGPDALVEAELASWAGGRGDSKTRRLRIGGAEKHCLWMVGDQAAKHEQSSKGGKTRAATASRAGGKFTRTPGGDPPAQTSPSEITTASDLPEISLPRAIPPSTEQVPAAPPATARPASETGSPPPIPAPGKSAWHRRSGWWALMLEADARVRAAGIEPNAPPMPKGCAGENERNLNACEKQLLEGGDDAETVDRKIRHLIAYRERECIRDRTRRWLSPAALWDPKRANYAFDRPLDEADKSPMARAGPQRSAARSEQPTIRPKTTDDEPPPIPSWE